MPRAVESFEHLDSLSSDFNKDDGSREFTTIIKN